MPQTVKQLVPAQKRVAVARQIKTIPMELSASERAAARQIVRDSRGEQERVIDRVVDRLMQQLGNEF